MSATATDTTTEFATSADGTPIAFERSGSGPVLVLVDGAFCYRGFGPSPALTKELRDVFTVVSYDRRGRGESGDTPPYAAEREIEDLAAVIAASGGDAVVLGLSSGAALAYRSAAAGVPMRRLIGYEAPWVGRRAGRDGAPLDYHRDLSRLIENGDNGKAIDYFMVDMIGAPRFMPIMMRVMRGTWKKLRAIAPTLRYDAAVMGSGFEVPEAELARVAIPVLAMAGSKGAPEMLAAQERVARAIPGARHRVLDGQTHQVAPSALRPAVVEFAEEGR